MGLEPGLIDKANQQLKVARGPTLPLSFEQCGADVALVEKDARGRQICLVARDLLCTLVNTSSVRSVAGLLYAVEQRAAVATAIAWRQEQGA